MTMTELQAAARAKGIGSSDVPCIMGLDPWRTSGDLWLQRRGLIPATVENQAMHLGTALEPVILSLAGERIGERVVRPSTTFVGEKPHHRANIDGMVGAAKRGAPIVEAKTTGVADDWGPDGSSEIPERVRAQVTWQMMCAGSSEAFVAALVAARGLDLRVYTVRLDAFLADLIAQRVDEFWESLDGDCPPAVASIESYRAMTRTERPDPVVIPADLFLAEAAAKAAAKAAESAHDAAQAALMAALGDATFGQSPEGHRIKVTQCWRNGFDSKRLLAERPELATYSTASTYARTTITPPKA